MKDQHFGYLLAEDLIVKKKEKVDFITELIKLQTFSNMKIKCHLIPQM